MVAATAGYSGTSLAKKLGIKANHRVALVSAPRDFESRLGSAPQEATISRRLRGTVDIFIFFPRNRRDLGSRFDGLAARLVPDGGLWVAWPKKSSGVATDLDFEAVQRTGLGAGLVDNKVCAVDSVYSGLRFVIRLKDRPTVGAGASRGR